MITWLPGAVPQIGSRREEVSIGDPRWTSLHYYLFQTGSSSHQAPKLAAGAGRIVPSLRPPQGDSALRILTRFLEIARRYPLASHPSLSHLRWLPLLHFSSLPLPCITAKHAATWREDSPVAERKKSWWMIENPLWKELWEWQSGR